VFWYARRRFPHNPHSHTQLGHALAMRGALAEGEAVHRQAIRRFPDDPVCWNDLAHTLRVAGRLEEALAVYREAQSIGDFHKNPVLACAMTGVLINLGRLQEAEAALAWAEQVGDDSPKDQRVLEDLRRRLKALASNKPMPAKQTHPAPEIAAGGLGGLSAITGIDLGPITALGEAALWRNAGEIDRAGRMLDALAPSAIVLVERGLCLAGNAGWSAARDHFQAIAARHPGDGAIQVHYQRARARCHEAADWQALWGRFEEYAPIFRLEQSEGAVRLPAELRNEDLDDTGEQARWVYQASGDASRRDLVEEDYIAARQIAY
jgi:tetratricopeptide (TPR) repeat protein